MKADNDTQITDTRSATFRNILVATDGRPATTHAIATGLSIGVVHSAAVHALYVVDTASSMGNYDLVVERFERDGELAVEAVVKQGEDYGLTVHPVFRYGTPHEAILSYAADHDIDLIIIGGHRRTGLRRYVGPKSVADLVARDADLPVLIVRQPHTVPTSPA